MEATERNNALFIADAIRHIFGIDNPIYIPWGKEMEYTADEFTNIQFLPESKSETVLSEFRTPVFGAITFEGGEYNMYDKLTGNIIKGRYGDYRLPHSCIVEFSRDANITKTTVLGSTGTVKEIYGKGDWDITIRGIALQRRDGTGETAQEQINSLVRWDNICDSIPVLGDIFRLKEIYNITITNISIQPIVGRWNAIPFQIDAVSDEPVELFLL